jgi:transposase InsO family protein
LDQVKLADRPRLLSDNGSSYFAVDLANGLGARNIKHVRGAPYHPMTQGKIQRWHQTLENRILLETTTSRVLSKSTSKPSSPITTTVVTTRASTISPPPKSTLDAGRSSIILAEVIKQQTTLTAACCTSLQAA